MILNLKKENDLKRTIRDEVILRFIFKNWKKWDYLIWLLHCFGIIMAWSHHNYLFLLINVLIEFIYRKINDKRLHHRLDEKRRIFLRMTKIKHCVKNECLVDDFSEMYDRLNKEIHKSGCDFIIDSKPLRVWLWAKSKFSLLKRKNMHGS